MTKVRIASPCSASWELMKGDDQVRFCEHCSKHVYNLSAMSRNEAEALLRNRSERMCARMYRREDGTFLTQDCPVGLRAKAVRLRRRLSLALSSILSLAPAWAQGPYTAVSLVQIASIPEISGKVVDPLGAPISRAEVILVDDASGAKKRVLAEDDGSFRMRPQPGSYTLKVNVPGFSMYSKSGVTFEKNARLNLKVTMQLGAIMGAVVEIVPPKQ